MDGYCTARFRAGVVKRLPRFRNKFPVVTLRVESELQNTKGVGIANFACRKRRPEDSMILASGANDELPDSVLGVGLALWILRRESLVVVVVPVNYHGGVCLVQILPEVFHWGIISVPFSRAEQRFVPVCKRAHGRMRFQILTQPFLFGR